MNEDILKLIHEISDKSVDERYIYRGEPEYHQDISSGLYRIYGSHPNFELIEDFILADARRHIRGITNTDDILAQLQHYGGVTNLIDFTTDYLIALFFACDVNVEKDGRIILLQSQYFRTLVPSVPANRAIAQKSIFVRPEKGYIETDNDKVCIVNVPSSLKRSIMKYLRECHGLYRQTIYNDLHGFIRLQNQNKRARKEFDSGLTCFNNKEYKASIQHYSEAIKLDPEHAGSWNNRGAAYIKVDDIDMAIKDFRETIELDPKHESGWSNLGFCYLKKGDTDSAINHINKAIELNPKYVDGLFNRAIYSLYVKDWSTARTDLASAKNLGADIVKIFEGDYEDISTFETKSRIKIPREIAEMLS